MTVADHQNLGMKTLTARDYVQDGLIALYDGIENAGNGKHDNSSKRWANLAQPAGDSDLNIGDDVIWHDSFLQLPPFGKDGAKTSLNGSIMQMKFLDAIENHSYTYQSVIGLDNLDENPYDTSKFGKQRPGVTFATWYGPIGPSLENNWLKGSIGDNGSGSWWPTANTNEHGILGDYCMTETVKQIPGLNVGVEVMFYKNEVKLPTNQAYWPTDGWGGSFEQLQAGMKTVATNNWSVGSPYNKSSCHRQYCFRLYSRALSEDEIIHNVNVDKERFGI